MSKGNKHGGRKTRIKDYAKSKHARMACEAKMVRRLPKPLQRKIHFSETEVWSYTFGRGGAKIRTPDCKQTFSVSLDKLTGKSWDVIERGRSKGTSDAHVYPSHVRDYIIAHLRQS